MVTPAVEAAAAEAAFWLHEELKRSRGWLRHKRREQALRKYLADVVKAHLDALLAEPFLPGPQEAEDRLAAAIEHAIQEAGHSDVAAAAARYDSGLARLWRAGYKLELARRWERWQADPRPPHTTPEREEMEAQTRADLAELARCREAERHEGAGLLAPAGGGQDGEVERRLRLLAEYMEATGVTEYAIYMAAGRNHSCHKAEFRKWKKGELPADSETALSLERFLKSKKPPSTQKRKFSSR